MSKLLPYVKSCAVVWFGVFRLSICGDAESFIRSLCLSMPFSLMSVMCLSCHINFMSSFKGLLWFPDL